jgi:K+-sensing histidine kinase KdpD
MAGRLTRPSVGRWARGLLVSVALVAVISGVIALLEPQVPALRVRVLYLLAVLPVAIVFGTALAAVTAILSIVVYTYLFVPPIGSIRVTDQREFGAMVVFVVTAVVVGELAARFRREAQQAARLSQEQSALRRVATLVAQAGPPSVVFEAVTREVGLLCDADLARMERYEADGTVTGVAGWGQDRSSWPWGPGSAWTGRASPAGSSRRAVRCEWTASARTPGRSPRRRGRWGSAPRWAARSWSAGGCGG